jgi:O-antigen/teichoic acid export membrane protein
LEENLRLAAGLLDQAVVSSANFALNVLLARELPSAQYGIISVAMSLLLFCNTLHQALIVYPHSLRVAVAPRRRQGYLLTVDAILTLMLGLVSLPAIFVGLESCGAVQAFLPISLGLVLWQLQEVARRSFLARNRVSSMLAVDAVRYVGALCGAILFLPRLTIEWVFALIAVSSACGAVSLVLPAIRFSRIAARNLRAEVALHWRMAAPVLGANSLAVFSTQWFLWLLAWHGRPDDAAALVALANIVAISNPVMFGVENVLVPEIVRAQQGLRFVDLLRLLRRRAAACTALVAPFFILIAGAPQLVVHAVYGAATPYAGSPGALRLLVGTYACYLASYMLGAVLRAYRAGPEVLQVQLYPALLGVSVGSWLVWQYGLFGACLASLLAGCVRVALGLWFVWRLRGVTAGASAALSAR